MLRWPLLRQDAGRLAGDRAEHPGQGARGDGPGGGDREGKEVKESTWAPERGRRPGETAPESTHGAESTHGVEPTHGAGAKCRAGASVAKEQLPPAAPSVSAARLAWEVIRSLEGAAANICRFAGQAAFLPLLCPAPRGRSPSPSP